MVWTAAQVALGGLFLAAMAQVSIPLYPVPMTLHTFAVFMLAIGQGEKKGAYSCLFYLALLSMGLPFLQGWGANTHWYLFPTGGYLLSFPIAAFVIGKIVGRQENPSPLRIVGSILSGQLIIYTLGVAGLMRFLSFEQSLISGMLIFLPLAGVKLLAATSLGGLWLKWKRKAR